MFKKLLQPGESVDYLATGSWVRVDQGSKVRIVTDAGQKAVLNGQDTAEFNYFNGISITNKSAEAEEIDIRVSSGRIVAANDGAVVSVGNDVSISDAVPVRVEVTSQPPIAVSATVNQSNVIRPLVDVDIVAGVVKLLVAANSKRKEVLIKNRSVNTGAVRVGDAAVSAGKGYELEPGESVIITTTASVHGFCDESVSLSLTELEFV